MNIKLTSEFKISALIACILFDIIDTVMDFLEIGLTNFGFGSGLISGISNTFDYIMIIIGFITFYLIGKDDISPAIYLPVTIDPMVDEAIPIPSYTMVYLFTVIKGWSDGKK